MNRAVHLLKEAAAALDDGRDPFHESFLIEHDVTGAECFALSEHLALGARLVAWAVANPKAAAAAVNGAHMSVAYETLNRALERLTSQRGGS